MSWQQTLFDYRPPAAVLAERVVLITGASQGIGRAVARACAGGGAKTLLLGRDVPNLERVANTIITEGNPEPLIVPFNLEGATVDDYQRIATLIAEQSGCLDGLVLNAGVLGELTPLSDYDPNVWARVIHVNLNSTFLMIQAMLPLLHRSTDASVVLTSSSVGRKGRAYWGAYAVSKFAVEGLMQTLADELENDSSIRVNSLNPGRVRTRMRAQAYPAEDPNSLPSPDSIVNAYLFLLGPASRGLHGAALEAQG